MSSEESIHYLKQSAQEGNNPPGSREFVTEILDNPPRCAIIEDKGTSLRCNNQHPSTYPMAAQSQSLRSQYLITAMNQTNPSFYGDFSTENIKSSTNWEWVPFPL